jgi:hypothetical protein
MSELAGYLRIENTTITSLSSFLRLQLVPPRGEDQGSVTLTSTTAVGSSTYHIVIRSA